MKPIKILSLLAASALLVGCANRKSGGDEKPEDNRLDEAIAELLSDTNLIVPSLKEYHMDFDVLYYYQYGMYYISATCDDPSGVLEDQYSASITSDTNWVVYNDEDYTIEDYGHMYADDFDNANFELDVDSYDGIFSVALYRYDGEHGTLDVSDVDTSWYVDYVNFYGFEVSNEFPSAFIQSKMSFNVPSLNGQEFCYGYSEAGFDDNGDYQPEEVIILVGSEVATAYASTLTGQGYTLEETEDYTITEDWDILEYSIYSGFDANHEVYISFFSLDGITQIEIYNFDDFLVDELTSNTDWTASEKALMNQYLGQELPFVQLGDGYTVQQGTDYYGDPLIYISDAYYADLTLSIDEALTNAGFKFGLDGNQNYFYEYDNHEVYIAIYIDYSLGNSIMAYYEASHYVPATDISLSAAAVDIIPGASYELTATLTPETADSTYTYSSNQDWCEVNQNGVVNISSEAPVNGVATVTVTTAENLTDTCTFTVCANAVTGFTPNVTELRLIAGETYQFDTTQFTLSPYGTTLGEGDSYSFGPGNPINEHLYTDDFGNVRMHADSEIGETAVVHICLTVNGHQIDVDVPVVVVAPYVTDVLTQSTFGLEDGNDTYAVHTSTGANGTYEAQCASKYGIQIRSKNDNSGIVGSCTGKTVKSITIQFDSNTTSGRTVDIYASSTEFGISNMYGSSTPTKVSSISYDGSIDTITFNFPEDSNYSYIGLRSASGALYMTSVTVVWG